MSGSMRGKWKRSYGRAAKAPPDERGGKQTCPAYRRRATSPLYPHGQFAALILNGTASEDLPNFIIKNDGIVKCVAAELKEREKNVTADARASKSDQEYESAVLKRRPQFPPIEPVRGIELAENEQIFSILFELLDDGFFQPIAKDTENKKTARRYLADDLPKRGRPKRS